jgi:glutathione S-transferase
MRVWVKYQDDVLYHAQRPATFQLMVRRMLSALSKEELERLVISHPQPQRARHFLDWATGPVDLQVVAEAKEKLAVVLGRLEHQLSTRKWLAGQSYSLAECAYAPFIDRLDRLKFQDLWADKPNVQDWMKRVRARPAFARSAAPSQFVMPGP